jgi:hypothetical protein
LKALVPLRRDIRDEPVGMASRRTTETLYEGAAAETAADATPETSRRAMFNLLARPIFLSCWHQDAVRAVRSSRD